MMSREGKRAIGLAMCSRRRFCCWLAAGAAALATGALNGCSFAEGARALSGTGDVGEADRAVGAEGASAALTDDAAAASSAADPLVATEFLFDTIITLTVYGSQAVLDEALERCRFFEAAFSRTKEGSDVHRINAAAGARVEVAPETADVIGKALEYCEQSDGLFDITIGAVTQLWDFKEGVRPSDEALAEAVRHIDWRGVTVEGTAVQLADPQAALDLGGIAKGYIADDLVGLLRERGVESACINLGGNVAVLGAKPDGTPWNVGVQDPNGAAQDVIAAVACENASVVTSGLYERQFTEDGVLYYHILDPRTGYPVETDLVSTSLKTASSTDGDAMATMLFLMGHDAALACVNEDARFEGLVVEEGGAISLTDHATFTVLEEAQ